VKVAVYLIAFYLVYSIMLSRDTSYNRNRAFILLSLVLSLFLPLITLHTAKPLNIQFFGKLLSEVFITAVPKGAANMNSGLYLSGVLQIIYTTYIIGVIFFTLKLLIDLLNLLFLIVREKSTGSRIIRFHGFNTAGFSAMGYIFINASLNPEEAGEIIKHEHNHLKKNHFIDIIFIETIKAIQWFNPVIYLFNRSLRAIHEYQADQECLSSGIPTVKYQNLLLNQVFKSRAFNLTNSFSNPSLIRQRMIMMTKNRTSAFANMKLFLVVPVIGLVFFTISAYGENTDASQNQIEEIATISQPSPSDYVSETMSPPPPPSPPPSGVIEKAEKESDSNPFVIVEEMPVFPGGDAALLKYIAENTTYPESAKEKSIQGKVIIRFCVTAKGGVNQISVLKGVDPELDAEAIRVARTLPLFKPGRQGGKAVAVWYMVPITFALK
ncbi:MAG TPA: M56 family metallopeptidase, partial [Anaerovoracaceae bacterium]|nr:M56 family metallopeptidase [Anaerovoracaceae bacterium]